MMWESQLTSFFQDVGPLHATNVYQALPAHLPLLKQYPEVAAPHIVRFRGYLANGPQHNVPAALLCLTMIAKEVPGLRDQIVRDVGDVLDEYLLVPGMLTDEVSSLEQALEVPISAHDAYVRDWSRKVITLAQPLILVMGAGFSYDVMPITTELRPLLVTVLRQLGMENPVSLLEPDDRAAWDIIRAHATDFQKAFAGWCAARSTPALQHIAAAEMLRSGEICHLISFNWDGLIEEAYRGQFGEDILKITADKIVPECAALWKLHGDVDDPSEPWVFPYGPGRVFDTLMESLEKTVKEKAPAGVLIVGYSESEPEVQAKLVGWLEKNGLPILRVRPNWPAGQSGGLTDSANRFFRRLSAQMSLDRRRKPERA